MAVSKFYELIKGATLEKDVEHVYSTGINLYFPNVAIEHPFACDGLIDTKTDNGKLLKLIIEYKIDEQFTSKIVRAKVITQVLFYIKQFELNGYQLPNICMVGDKNECFVFHSNSILSYLGFEGIDWKIAPSKAHIVYPQLVQTIAEDENVNPFIFDITDEFSFQIVVDKIKDLANAVQRYVHITEHNIAGIYEMFLNRVIKNEKKYKSHDLVGLFMGIITNPDEYYKHPSKKNTLVTPNGGIDIEGRNFDSFFSYFQRTYTPQEKNNLTAIADRLIEDTSRRKSGDFWSPTIWVDYAHNMISKELGENWRDEYVVYDPAAGSKNLTRDYNFKKLYCSTLYDSELKIGERYNKNSTSFQFDFLNDYFPMNDDELELNQNHENKVPQGLVDVLKQNKKILFFINPPYGKSTGAGGKIASGNSDSNVKTMMKKEGIEGSELLKQFLYRIVKIKQSYNLTNLYVACFTKPSWLLKPQSKAFREMWLKEFSYVDGIMFCASEFANCSNNWGITFNIWKVGESENKNEFLHKLMRRGNDGGVEIIGKKILYNFDNCDNISPAEYINKPIQDKKKEKNIIICKDIKTMLFENVVTRVFDDYLCTVGCFGSDIQQNNHSCLRNSIPEGGGYLQCTKNNILESCISVAIRQLIIGDWINDKDMYNMNVEIPMQFKLDCLVWSIFTNYCCSYKLNNEQLINHFFWMSKEEILILANDNNNDDVYNDCRTAENRFVYNFIQEHYNEFSDDAITVLNKAKELVIKSFPYRKMFDEEHKNYQINNWDAGWYQIKTLCKEFLPDELKEFQDLYKMFGNRMRPMVYELQFLKQ